LKNECSCEADISPTFSILGITGACCGIPTEVDIPNATYDIFTKGTNFLNQEAQRLKINAILSGGNKPISTASVMCRGPDSSIWLYCFSSSGTVDHLFSVTWRLKLDLRQLSVFALV